MNESETFMEPTESRTHPLLRPEETSSSRLLPSPGSRNEFESAGPCAYHQPRGPMITKGTIERDKRPRICMRPAGSLPAGCFTKSSNLPGVRFGANKQLVAERLPMTMPPEVMVRGRLSSSTPESIAVISGRRRSSGQSASAEISSAFPRRSSGLSTSADISSALPHRSSGLSFSAEISSALPRRSSGLSSSVETSFALPRRMTDSHLLVQNAIPEGQWKNGTGVAGSQWPPRAGVAARQGRQGSLSQPGTTPRFV